MERKREREEPCLHRQASQAWGQPARARGLCASSVPTLQGRGWVEIWPKLLSSLSPAQLNWGNWYLVSSSITGSRERSCASLQCSGHQGKLLEWDLGGVGCGAVALGCAEQALKSFTVPGGELSPHSMESMGIGAGLREGAA